MNFRTAFQRALEARTRATAVGSNSVCAEAIDQSSSSTHWISNPSVSASPFHASNRQLGYSRQSRAADWQPIQAYIVQYATSPLPWIRCLITLD
jgi:hypothetical protein